jgi:hypothetical protein
MIAGFREGLKEAGYIEGQNVAIDFRTAQGRLRSWPCRRLVRQNCMPGRSFDPLGLLVSDE